MNYKYEIYYNRREPDDPEHLKLSDLVAILERQDGCIVEDVLRELWSSGLVAFDDFDVLCEEVKVKTW